MPPKHRRLMKQPNSTGWFDLPFEMHEMVIDRMDSKTRCRFAKCSKQCEKEAHGSRSYMHEIKAYDDGKYENYQKLSIYFSHEEKADSERYDFWLDFHESEEQTIVVYNCYTNDGQEVAKWVKVESGKNEDVRMEYFNAYLQKYKSSIRKVGIKVRTSLSNFNVENLKHLETLKIEKIQSGIPIEQLVRIKYLYIPSCYLTFEQIISLKCIESSVSSKEFDEENTNKYLKMIKNGEIYKNLKSINIYWGRKTVLDIHRVMDGLDVFDYNETREKKSFKFRSKNGVFCASFPSTPFTYVDYRTFCVIKT